MRNYIILNGKNSNQINGLLIQELPPISKPLLRNQIEEIDGRDGDIVTPLGYSAYDKEFTIGLYKDFDVNEVAAYFNSEGTVIFSNEPDKYYYYQITAQIDFERLVRYRTATVTMHCQPFKYSATEQPITEDVSGTVSDEGTNIALENTAEAPFNTLDLKGNTEQDTLSGKNLAKLKDGTYSYSAAGQTWNIADGVIRATRTDVTHQGGAINIATGAVAQWAIGVISDDHLTGSGGTYTLTFRRAGNVAPSSTSTAKVCIYGFIYDDDGGSTSGNGQMLVDISSQSSGTYTLNLAADKHLGALVFYSQYISYSDVEFKVQLEQGTATDFEPYCGGIQSPNPDYPQDIRVVTGENVVKVTGKNILKPSENLHASRQGLTNVVNDDGSITTSGKPTANWNTVVYPSVDITDRLEDGETYTISQRVKTNKLYLQVNARNKNTGTVQHIALNDATSKSFTVDRSSYDYGYTIQSPLITTWGDDTPAITNYYQIEKSSQATDFESYQEQTYPVSLMGKNIIDVSALGSGTINGLTYSVASDGTISVSGTSTTSTHLAMPYTLPQRLLGKTVTFSYSGDWGNLSDAGIKQNTNGIGLTLRSSTTSATSTITQNYIDIANRLDIWVGNRRTVNAAFKLQLELGDEATAYEQYTPIELCGLMDTDYRDRIYKNADKWYIHKEIGKYVLTGASQENWYISGQSLKCNSLNDLGYPDMSSEYAYISRLTTQLYSNYGLVEPAANIFDGAPYRVGLGYKGGGGGTKDAIYVSNGTITAVDDWRALLAATPLICYYALATPTDTEITNKTLIEQLDDIYYHAHAYKGRTHIRSSAATGNVPFVISAEVVEDNESTITNAGNYLSKPKITVYGSGDISLYINDMHVLKITLGDEGYITIDTAQMEAYKDTLDNLKNRLVIGDYSNARLKPGANKIHFTGKVTKYVVENYSRWL